MTDKAKPDDKTLAEFIAGLQDGCIKEFSAHYAAHALYSLTEGKEKSDES